MSDDLTPEEVDALSQAMDGENSPQQGNQNSISKAQFLQLEEIAKEEEIELKDLEKLYDLQVEVEVVLGRTRKKLEDVLKLGEGSVVELKQLAREPVELEVNGRVIAKGEVVVVDDHFGVQILEIANMPEKVVAASAKG